MGFPGPKGAAVSNVSQLLHTAFDPNAIDLLDYMSVLMVLFYPPSLG